MSKVALNTDQMLWVQNVLRSALPKEAKVWVFGSRATGLAKPFSDLDLAIDAGKPLSLSQLALLTEHFEESALPYKVDVVDMCTVSERFKKIIDETKVTFEFPNK